MHIKLAKKIKNKLKKSLILRYINQKLDFLLKKKIPEAFSIINNLKIDTAVDVGSNTGKWTYYLSKVSKNVISFEPTSLLFKLNKKLFSGTKKIKTYNFALGSTNTNTIIKIPDDNLDEASIGKKFKSFINVNTENIKIICGDKILKNEKIDLIKIDVEGYEIEVIGGLKKTIIKNFPVLIIEIEKRHNALFLLTFEQLKFYGYLVFYQKKNNLYLINSDYKKFVTKNQKIRCNMYIHDFWFINKKSSMYKQITPYLVY
jgi:FkbM family methyltransferase